MATLDGHAKIDAQRLPDVSRGNTTFERVLRRAPECGDPMIPNHDAGVLSTEFSSACTTELTHSHRVLLPWHGEAPGPLGPSADHPRGMRGTYE